MVKSMHNISGCITPWGRFLSEHEVSRLRKELEKGGYQFSDGDLSHFNECLHCFMWMLELVEARKLIITPRIINAFNDNLFKEELIKTICLATLCKKGEVKCSK
jgi:hypothetical protein